MVVCAEFAAVTLFLSSPSNERELPWRGFCVRASPPLYSVKYRLRKALSRRSEVMVGRGVVVNNKEAVDKCVGNSIHFCSE